MTYAVTTEQGLPRTALAGPGHTLMDAFASLRASPRLTSIVEHTGRRLLGARMLIGTEEGTGYWDFYELFDSVYIVLCDFVYLQAHSEPIPGEGLLEFHIKLSGSLTLQLNRPDSLSVAGPSLLIWNQPIGCDSVVASKPGTRDRSLSLYCKPSFLRDKIILDDSAMPHLFKELLRENQQSINYLRVPLSIEIIETAESLFGTQLTHPFSLVFVEAKALELLYRIVSTFEKLSCAADERYTSADLQRFRAAREILTRHHCPPPTIAQLARQVGVNKTKLTRGFRSVFGMTLFEYATHCRMQTALRMLRESSTPIGLIAESLGYKHQTTFTAAYKRCFGFLPKDVRKAAC